MPDAHIRAGEYEFNTSMTPASMIDKLLRGEIKKYRVIIPEDLSVKEIAARLEEYKLIDEKDFFELAEMKNSYNLWVLRPIPLKDTSSRKHITLTGR